MVREELSEMQQGKCRVMHLGKNNPIHINTSFLRQVTHNEKSPFLYSWPAVLTCTTCVSLLLLFQVLYYPGLESRTTQVPCLENMISISTKTSQPIILNCASTVLVWGKILTLNKTYCVTYVATRFRIYFLLAKG